eukprot:TRINITY_DN27718_c0_g4_i1.p1 TRINITY_DN27718_c0_g4~~TRINITY_DN27718_c0_g4_i1.p1  ORF type:complete len:334 (+),score=66.06 TRINITY_DN27718_c0_g4_i1:195-1196(+)
MNNLIGNTKAVILSWAAQQHCSPDNINDIYACSAMSRTAAIQFSGTFGLLCLETLRVSEQAMQCNITDWDSLQERLQFTKVESPLDLHVCLSEDDVTIDANGSDTLSDSASDQGGRADNIKEYIKELKTAFFDIGGLVVGSNEEEDAVNYDIEREYNEDFTMGCLCQEMPEVKNVQLNAALPPMKMPRPAIGPPVPKSMCKPKRVVVPTQTITMALPRPSVRTRNERKQTPPRRPTSLKKDADTPEKIFKMATPVSKVFPTMNTNNVYFEKGNTWRNEGRNSFVFTPAKSRSRSDKGKGKVMSDPKDAVPGQRCPPWRRPPSTSTRPPSRTEG